MQTTSENQTSLTSRSAAQFPIISDPIVSSDEELLFKTYGDDRLIGLRYLMGTKESEKDRIVFLPTATNGADIVNTVRASRLVQVSGGKVRFEEQLPLPPKIIFQGFGGNSIQQQSATVEFAIEGAWPMVASASYSIDVQDDTLNWLESKILPFGDPIEESLLLFLLAENMAAISSLKTTIFQGGVPAKSLAFAEGLSLVVDAYFERNGSFLTFKPTVGPSSWQTEIRRNSSVVVWFSLTLTL